MKQQTYVMTQYGDIAGTLRARGDSSPCADSGQNVVCMADTQSNAAIGDMASITAHSSKDAPVICMADDNAKAAIDDGLSGTLKVGGGSPVIACSPTEGM